MVYGGRFVGRCPGSGGRRKIGYVDVRAVLAGKQTGKQHKANLEAAKDKQAAIKKEEDKLKSLQQTLEKEILTLTEARSGKSGAVSRGKFRPLKMGSDAVVVTEEGCRILNKALEEIRGYYRSREERSVSSWARSICRALCRRGHGPDGEGDPEVRQPPGRKKVIG